MKISKTVLVAMAGLASGAQASVHGEGSMGDWFLLILVMAAPWLLLGAAAVGFLVWLARRLGRNQATAIRTTARKPD